jgi:hypothetical protein
LDIGEILLQYSPAKWVYLYLPNCLDSCPLKAQIEAADPSKQTAVGQLLQNSRILISLTPTSLSAAAQGSQAQ